MSDSKAPAVSVTAYTLPRRCCRRLANRAFRFRASPTTGLTLTAASGTFIPTTAYTDLVTALTEIDDRNPFSEGSRAAREWRENEIKLVLGMTGDIWPLEIRGDLIIDALEHADRQQNLIRVAFPQHRFP